MIMKIKFSFMINYNTQIILYESLSFSFFVKIPLLNNLKNIVFLFSLFEKKTQLLCIVPNKIKVF